MIRGSRMGKKKGWKRKGDGMCLEFPSLSEVRSIEKGEKGGRYQ